MLFSYVIKTPNYLETEDAIKELKEKEESKQEKNITTSFRLQEKLKKLKDLKELNLITDEEYTSKKNQLLDTF